MIKKQITMEHSPFPVERDIRLQRNTQTHPTDVSPEVYHDVMKYVNQKGNDFNKSQFLRELINEETQQDFNKVKSIFNTR